MSAGAIYILETDDGPMDRLLEGGMPSQAQLQSEFGTEHLTNGVSMPSGTPGAFVVILLCMIIVLVAAILGVDYVTRKNPIKHTRN